jgi:RNA polymerase sigma-70 factor (ECF subfamily)
MKEQQFLANDNEASGSEDGVNHNCVSQGDSPVPALNGSPGHLLGGQQSSLELLLQRCLQSNEDALWTEFIRRSQPLIAGVIIRSTRNWTGTFTPSLVDDLVQDTYLKLCAANFKALRGFECKHEFALCGFLKVVARNVVHDHFRGSCSRKRGSGKEPDSLTEAAFAHAENSNGVAHLNQIVLLHEIRALLATRVRNKGSARDCKIFWLYYSHGLPAKAIAELPCIALTVKGVESTLLRLTRLVREQLYIRRGR